jgi:NAD(P)-dependent dehydrogenase (short-subunit alcohol dehydrogenase family)
VTFQVSGANGGCSIPATATAIGGTLTAVGPTAGGFLTAYPTGGVRPLTSNLNFVAGNAPIGNSFTATLSSSGAFDLFNNAGHGGAPGNVSEIDAAGWDHTFALLVRGPALGMKHALPHMVKRGGGSVINTASIAGLQAGFGPLAYSTAKCAVIHMSKCAAAELSPLKIRVNAICPGLIATSIFGASMGLPRDVADQMAARMEEIAPKIQPIPKAGMPEDIARAALYLACDDSLFVTGTHIVVDGGLTIGGRGSWDPQAANPILDALGITPEQAEQMRTAMAAQQKT